MNTPVLDKHTALLVVDVQEALDHNEDGPVNNTDAEAHILELMHRFRTEQCPLFIIQYQSPRPGSPFHKDAPYCALKKEFRPLPGEPLIVKHFESAFMETGLERQLSEQNITTLIVTGFYTDQCVASTAKGANNLGFNVIVPADTTATTGCKGADGVFYTAEQVFQLALGGLLRDGITVPNSLLDLKPTGC